MSSNRSAFTLARLRHFVDALARTTDLTTVKSLRDKAEAARKYAQNAALSLKVQNQAAELKLRAERRAGTLLRELAPHGGNRRSSFHSEILKLSDLGINASQSARWRREAAVPEAVFEQFIAMANQLGKEITSSSLLRLQRAIAARRRGAARCPHGVREVVRCWPSLKRSFDSVGGSATLETIDSATELFVEMKNHRRLLEQILRPHCNAEHSTFQISERRLVLRLLTELEELLESLERTLAHCRAEGG
jgi:hypothetical protein